MEFMDDFKAVSTAAQVGERIREAWDGLGGRFEKPLWFTNVDIDSDPASILQNVAKSAGLNTVEYIGGNSPRTRVDEAVYTSTEYPSRKDLTLHQELSYEEDVPDLLMFYCAIAAESGGETPIADASEVLAQLPDSIVSDFEDKGVRYRQLLPADNRQPGKTWMDQFQTDDRSVCEALLAERNVSFSWRRDGALTIDRTRKGVRIHPVTGKKLWFNQADQWDARMSMTEPELRVFDRLHGAEAAPHSVAYGDGSPIDLPVLQEVRDTILTMASRKAWTNGALMVIDNRQHMHGRMAFSGARRVLVSMGDMA